MKCVHQLLVLKFQLLLPLCSEITHYYHQSAPTELTPIAKLKPFTKTRRIPDRKSQAPRKHCKGSSQVTVPILANSPATSCTVASSSFLNSAARPTRALSAFTTTMHQPHIHVAHSTMLICIPYDAGRGGGRLLTCFPLIRNHEVSLPYGKIRLFQAFGRFIQVFLCLLECFLHTTQSEVSTYIPSHNKISKYPQQSLSPACNAASSKALSTVAFVFHFASASLLFAAPENHHLLENLGFSVPVLQR